MTKKELLEAIKDMPESAEVLLYSGAFYRKLEFAKMHHLWVDLQWIDAIALHPAYKHEIA